MVRANKIKNTKNQEKGPVRAFKWEEMPLDETLIHE
jgi:hypothetical protein